MNFVVAHRRWFVGAFIIVALAVLVWLAGPQFRFGETRPLATFTARTLTVLSLVLLWLAIEGGRMWLERRRNRAMLDALSAGGEDDKLSRYEAQTLATRFEEAMAKLKERKLDGKLVYQLPWYIFIGDPGTGKSVALRNSGLRFPLAPPGAASELAGVGGTRNCDWWFADNAVLIDTAGRLVSQDSNAKVDQAAWQAFLRLLKKHRPRQPINGIIMSLSVEDLFALDAGQRIHQAQRMRMRIEELERELGLQFPVYLMVTKCDLLSGFTEFFAGLHGEQRAQVWGSTFDFDLVTRKPPHARASFDAAFAPLVERINQLLLPRLSEERNVDRRTAMYSFPQQFAALGPLIGDFLEAAFNESRYARPVILRGVYFTSGTQFGTPIDRLVRGIAESLGLRSDTPRSAAGQGAGKSYFIEKLLSEVIFVEAGLAGHSEQRERQLKWLSWTLLVTTLAVSIGLAAGWTASFLNNRGKLAQAATAASAAAAKLAAVGPPAVDDLPALVDALEAMQKVPPAVHDPVDRPPASMRLGLYQGEAVADQIAVQYRHALQRGLLSRIALQLEAVMDAPQADPERIYTALKAYRMLYDPKRLDKEWFVNAVTDIWRTAFDPPLVEQGRQHLRALVATDDLFVKGVHPRNDAVADKASRRAAASSPADRAYALLRLPAVAGEGVRLSDVLGPAGVDWLERPNAPLTEPIAASFTAAGYRQSVKPGIRKIVETMAAEDAWVLERYASNLDRGASEAIMLAVQRRYFEEFKSVWRSVMNELRLRKLDGLGRAQTAAQVLAQSDSPLRKLVVAVGEQTRLSGPVSSVRAGVDAIVQDKMQERVAAATGTAASQVTALARAAMPTDPTRQLEKQVEDEFSDVRRLAGDGKTGEIDAALASINEVAVELGALQRKLAGAQPIRELPAVLDNAKRGADRFAMPVSGVIKSLVRVAEIGTKDGIKKDIGVALGGASALCRRAVPGRYPFGRNATQDVGVQDFATVFKADGDLAKFFGTYLDQLVDKRDTWRFKATGEGTQPVSEATLRQFQNADAIRSAFLGGGATPQVVVDLTVVSADGEIGLDYGGMSHRLKPGESVRLNWPPAAPGARLAIGGAEALSVSGMWALFRMVDRGQLDASSGGDRLRLAYTASNGLKASLDLRAGSAVYNPLRLRELGGFSCP